MYSLYSLGIRITLGGVDDLPLAATEVRKATKSTQTTKQDYKWRQQGLRILEEIVVVTSALKTRGNLEKSANWTQKLIKGVAVGLKQGR